MGVSTDGILFYGFPIEEGSDLHDRITEEDSEDQSEDKIAWLKEYGNSDLGISIGTHCSYEYPMYYLYSKEVTAARGYPKELDVTVDPMWNKNFQAFCKKYQIPWIKPKWWLASLWG